MRDIAIRNIHPNVTVISSKTDAFDKNRNAVILDESAIATEVIRLEKEYSDNEYARNRATEYPALADQLDEIYHNGINAWKAVIKVTKDKYPKG